MNMAACTTRPGRGGPLGMAWPPLSSTKAGPRGAKVAAVDPIRTEDWPTPAKRPADSRLDSSKLARVFGVRQPDWRSGVAAVVAELLAPQPIRG